MKEQIQAAQKTIKENAKLIERDQVLSAENRKLQKMIEQHEEPTPVFVKNTSASPGRELELREEINDLQNEVKRLKE